jgi:hypothetical protein
MTYDAILAPLDKRWGRPVTINDWARVGEKHVADVSDDDLVIVEAFAGRARRAALEAARDRWLTPAPVSTPVDVTTTKAAAPETPVVSDDDLTWAQFMVKHGAAPMTLHTTASLFDGLLAKWHEMNEKNKERNAKIAALEARVLELEAHAAAARTVAHVGR